MVFVGERCSALSSPCAHSLGAGVCASLCSSFFPSLSLLSSVFPAFSALPSLLPLCPSLSFLLSDVPPPHCSDWSLSVLPVVNRALWRPASTQLALEERGRAQATPSSFLSGQLTATASSQQEDGGPALGHSWGPCAASAGLLAAGPRQVAGPRGLLCCGAVTAHVFAGPSKALVDAHGRTEVTVGDRWGTSWPLYPHSPVTACWQDVQTAQRHRRTGTEGML